MISGDACLRELLVVAALFVITFGESTAADDCDEGFGALSGRGDETRKR